MEVVVCSPSLQRWPSRSSFKVLIMIMKIVIFFLISTVCVQESMSQAERVGREGEEEGG